MATFFQGAQLSQVLKIIGTNTDLDPGEYPIIYTVPSGFYGLIKFAYIGSNDINYLQPGGTSASIYVNDSTSPSSPTLGIVVAVGNYGWRDQKLAYIRNITYSEGTFNVNNDSKGIYDMYLDEGDKFQLFSASSNQNVKYELHIHLYKKP